MTGQGVHTMIDGRLGGPVTEPFLSVFMVDCVASIGMTVVSGPHFSYPAAGSMTGFLILAESHVSVHICHETAMVDVYSCKRYDPDVLHQFVIDRLGLLESWMTSIERGWNIDRNR